MGSSVLAREINCQSRGKGWELIGGMMKGWRYEKTITTPSTTLQWMRMKMERLKGVKGWIKSFRMHRFDVSLRSVSIITCYQGETLWKLKRAPDWYRMKGIRNNETGESGLTFSLPLYTVLKNVEEESRRIFSSFRTSNGLSTTFHQWIN